MSLQRRLTSFALVIVVLPLALVALVLQRMVVDDISRRAEASLAPALRAAVAVYNDRADAIDERVRAAIGGPAFGRILDSGDRDALRTYLERALARDRGIDFLAVLGRNGRLVAQSRRAPRFVPGYRPPPMTAILSGRRTGEGYTRTAPVPMTLSGKRLPARVVGGFWVDNDLLAAARQESLDLSIAVDGRIVASTRPLEAPERVALVHGEPFDVNLGGEEARARAAPLARHLSIFSSSPSASVDSLSRRVLASLGALLGLALVATAALAYLLARLITQPLSQLALGAEEVSKGNFSHRIPVRSRDELGQVSTAFNKMAERLGETIGELSQSRDQLQTAIRRVGDTLGAATDMQQMLQSLLDSCVEAVQADCGVLWMISQGQDRLQPAYRRGLENQPLGGVSAGDGLAGLVLLERSSRLQHAPDAAFPAPGEPSLPEAAGVPLFADGHVRGVLAVYRRDASDPFDQEDLETLQFLVQQGEVAMENILLHEEARRLSLTDGLTGVWNRRYLQMQVRQMVASAMRFGRPFSVLMLDLDHFKAVNDTYGHPRGDAVLVEFTRRVKGVLREVDVFGRYGGEEFVCLLSETGLSGATATAGKIIHEIRSRPFHEGAETPLDITVSIGVASYPRHGSTFQALIAAADGALYNAKRNGRDRFETADEPVAVKGSANTAPDGGSSEPAP